MSMPNHPTHPAVEGQRRQPWEPPAIVFERSLEVSAQGGPPGPPGFGPQGFLGPLGTSGNSGNCK